MSDAPFSFMPPNRADKPYTVSEINAGIAFIIDAANPLVWVEGEISNWRVSSSGHVYFRLKDANSQIPAVMWRSTIDKLSFKPEDGLAVFAVASIRVYQKAGQYQLDVHRMEPCGAGAVAIAFEKLKKKLEQEGLFDPAHKKPLPASVQRIGVVTSKHGAAIRDIVRVIATRAPQTDIVLLDVPVQGETAGRKIAAGINDMNSCGNVDCMIVGRGGGSAEDLAAFNEEIVARAIYNSDIPVISAVGHEIDFTIADFVADIRAATPSAAAEMAVPDSAESRRFFDACAERFSGAFSACFNDAFSRFAACLRSRGLRLVPRYLFELRQRLDDDTSSCMKQFSEKLRHAGAGLASASSRLNDLSPLAVLSRGYSVVSTAAGIVRSAEQLAPGEKVSLRFHTGSATATVIETLTDSKSRN